MNRFRILLAALGLAGLAFCAFVAHVLLRFAAAAALPEIGIRAFVSLLLVSVGLWVGAARPELPSTRSAALGLYITGILWLRNSINAYLPLLDGTDAFLFYLFDVGYPLHLVFGLRFFCEFPPGVPPSRFFDALRRANDAIGVGLLAVAKVVELRPFVGWGGLGPLDWIYDHRSFYTGSALLAILAAGVFNYRRASDPDARRRVRWIVLGTVVALTPEMLAKFAKALGHDPNIELFTVVMVSALPLTFAYAVVKHRVLDIQVALGRGLHHLLARNVLRVLVAIPALAIALDVALEPERTVREVFFAGWPRLAVLGLAALALRFHGRLRAAVDRWLLGERLSPEEVFARLITRLRSADSPGEIPDVVSGELEAAFHPRSLEYLPRDSLPAELRDRLEHSDEPVDHGRQLAVPVRSGADALSGVIFLGEKVSGRAWGAGDRRLLAAIGSQVGYALETRALREKVAHEQSVSREVLARLNPMKECPTCGLCDQGAGEICPDDGTVLELGLPVEQMLDGKYRLERRIGRGGMGAVYRATDLGLGRAVAVKIVTGGRTGDRQSLRRFEREGRAMAKLAHPGLVTVYDSGKIGGHGAYLAMELLEGQTLRDELEKRDGPVPPATVAEWFAPVLDAVAAAHRAGVVHRDLKPENVFLTKQGQMKVLDFGLARLTQPEEGASMTVPGLIVGTLGYIAPEQFLGKEANEQSDIFSLGVMLFEALTGDVPFPAQSVPELATALFTDEAHLPGDHTAIWALDSSLQRCLAPDPRRRFVTVRELSRTILPQLGRCPLLVRDDVA